MIRFLQPPTTDSTEAAATTTASVNASKDKNNDVDKLPLKRLPINSLPKLRVQPLVVQDHGQLTQLLVGEEIIVRAFRNWHCHRLISVHIVESDSSRPPSETGERPVSPLPIRRLTDFQGETRPGSPTVIRCVYRT